MKELRLCTLSVRFNIDLVFILDFPDFANDCALLPIFSNAVRGVYSVTVEFLREKILPFFVFFNLDVVSNVGIDCSGSLFLK